MADLFSTQHEDAIAGVSSHAPLAVRMRPRTLDELLGQEHLIAPGSPLRRLVEAGENARVGPSSIILWGPPGTGKTTLAHVVSRAPGRKFVELSAITAGVKDVRAVMEGARNDRDLYGMTTVLFLDEIHRFTKAQQDALLPGVENRLIVLVAATTENPSFSVISPLLSRSLLLTLRPLNDGHIEALLRRAIEDERGLDSTVQVDDEALAHLVQLAGADARRGLTTLEAAAGVSLSRVTGGESATLTVADAEQALDRAVLRYDRQGDQHYDVTSAFIKSIRGSDVDASLHYLARMIEAGEDPRFIARRVMISASEDIGMADPSALPIAVAAAEAVQMLGMPEGRIPLAQAVVHLATAPKSNAAYLALDAAIADVRAGKAGSVPDELRDAHYPGAKELGHGAGYRYAHDHPHGVAEQQYPPDELVGRDYYRPTDHGAERDVAARLDRLREIVRGTAGQSVSASRNEASRNEAARPEASRPEADLP
ncbi:replication-associated recombination protein A [Saxibacter everestensis]|uniref:Replication-associated recombination protein A n=1 Tax=Saxibacter everestensis TaxID=2909229 RepID=A0ABY8QZE7_9MICO|nr:replication-associated recombination protein A [Brevibacteriaceae bacterium ZFBP1038]